jgi:16S rRNA G966 N2-methylase RsmD
LKPFSLLAKFIPNVQHISFQQNNINNVNQLSLLSGGGKLAQLKELIFIDNPFRENLLQKDATGETYKR